MEKPLLSIVTITYNHEPYIAKTIEGVLAQKVNFPVEYIIAEDCSTDGTRKICQEYADKYPDLIKLITSDSNVGAVKNERRAFEAAKGKYIATCEGDDYWTEPLKLQRQVDFLESHPDYSVCFHRYKIGPDDDGSFNDDDCAFLFNDPNIEGVDISMWQFLHRWVTQYLTMVFRKDRFDTNIIDKYQYFRDTHLMYHLLCNGKGYLFAFVGGVYFKTRKGMFSQRSLLQATQMTLAVDTEIWKVNKDKRMREMCVIVMQYMVDEYANEKINRKILLNYAWKILQYNFKPVTFIMNIMHIIA